MTHELWSFYLNNLQGHPTRCVSGESVNQDIIRPKIGHVFVDKDKPVLVLGCGDGKEAFVFKELGFKHVTGVTLGRTNIEASKKDYPSVDIILADMHDLSAFPTEKVQYVYCNQVFEHAFAPFLFCLEVWVVMCNNGLWYVEAPTHISKGSKLTDPMTAAISHHHPNMLLPEDAMRMFNATGFHIVNFVDDGNMKFILRKRPLQELAGGFVHSDVYNTLQRRLHWKQ